MTRSQAAAGTTPDTDGSRQFAGKYGYFIFSLAILALDQWSKWWIEMAMTSTSRLTVIPGWLDFTYVRNTGVAFGMFAAHGDRRGVLVLVILGSAALAFIAYYFWSVPRRDRWLLVSLSLVIGGAIGNLIDRIAQGGVTDFIDAYYKTYHWHTFNVADSAISVGITLMILGSFFSTSADPAAVRDGDRAPASSS